MVFNIASGKRIPTIETKISNKLSSRLGKAVPVLGTTGTLGEVGGISPPSNGKKNLELSVLTFQQAQLFDATVDVVSSIIP